MSHWVFRLKDGSYLSHRNSPKRYADKEERTVSSLYEARVFNSAASATNAGTYTGKYGPRDPSRGEAVAATVIVHDPVCRSCGKPKSNHPYRHPFVSL